MLDPGRLPQNRRRLHLREITDSGSDDTATVGGELRSARVKAGYDLREVADALRIRYQHLEALECGYHNQLPGKTYAVGFVRAYAEHLGLSPDDLTRRFKSEMGGPAAAAGPVRETPMDLGFPSPREETQLPTGTTMILVLLIVLGLGAGWFFSQSSSGPAEYEPEVPEAPQFVEPQTSLLRPPPSVPTDKPRPAPVSDSPLLQNLTAQNGVSAQADPETAVPVAETPAPEPEPEPVVSEADEAPAITEEASGSETALAEADSADTAVTDSFQGPPLPVRDPEAAAQETGEESFSALEQVVRDVSAAEAGNRRNIQIVALETAWIRVDNGQGDILIQRQLTAGEVFDVPADGGYVMAARNAGAFQIVLDGDSVGLAGRRGEFLSGLALDPAALQGR